MSEAVFSKRPTARLSPLINGSRHDRAELVQSPQIGDDLDADLSGLVAVALDQLQVAPTARFSDARVHGRTIHRQRPMAQAHNWENVLQQDFSQNASSRLITH